VYYNGKLVEVEVVRAADLESVVPYSGTFEYAGDGWWRIKGDLDLFLRPPGKLD